MKSINVQNILEEISKDKNILTNPLFIPLLSILADYSELLEYHKALNRSRHKIIHQRDEYKRKSEYYKNLAPLNDENRKLRNENESLYASLHDLTTELDNKRKFVDSIEYRIKELEKENEKLKQEKRLAIAQSDVRL